MISACQIRDYTEVSFGQISTPFRVLNFSVRDLNKIFETCILLYQKFRPITKILPQTLISSDGLGLPSDGIAFRRVHSEYDTMTPARHIVNENRLYVGLDGTYNVEYFAKLTYGRKIIDEVVLAIDDDIRTYDVTLGLVPTKTSLILYKEGEEASKMIYDSQTDAMSGNIGSATFSTDIDTEMTVTLDAGVGGNLKAKYQSAFYCCEDLDEIRDHLFIELFIAQSLLSLGMHKSVVALKELPYEMTADNLADFGRTRLEEITRELKENRSKWWVF